LQKNFDIKLQEIENNKVVNDPNKMVPELVGKPLFNLTSIKKSKKP